MTPAIDITAEQRRTVLALLNRYLPDTTVWAYGSRVKWTSRPESDLDLVAFARPEQSAQVADLREAFEESNLPFRVDLFMWDEVPEGFRARIEAEHVVLVKEDCNPYTDNEWPKIRIGEIAQVVGGSTPSTKDTNNFDGDVPWLTPKDLAGPHDRVVMRGSRNLSRRGFSNCSAKLVPPGTVCLSTRAPIGYVAIAGADIATNQGFRNLVLKSDVCSEFIYYWLKANTEELERHAAGTTFRELSGSALKGIHIPLPTFHEQRAIAHVLATLDDKIELNRRMNETLEGMAQALFKSWFVDFDPVRVKMEGRDTGLPQPIADLFPDQLVDSELGRIPEGWEVSEIGAEVDVLGGATPSTKEPAYWNDGEHHWATPKDLSKLSSLALLETDRKITDAGVQKIRSGLFPIGTVLLSSRAPIGYLAITGMPTAVNQGFIAMICERRLPNLYVLFWCHENIEHIKGISGGSTFSEISKKTFRPLAVVVPSKGILRVYENIGRSLYDRVVLNTRESALLLSLRDTLLPKLISGEIRLRDTARQVERVA